ncbi:MAG: phage portal protein [Lachnospiraceae bacterium]|nr:phage portal protein [Lachnospiraceae bacterium]
MLLTETDLINMKITAEAGVNNSDIIRDLINEDISSNLKKNMADGERYYVGEHDIYQKDFRKTYISETANVEGSEVESRKIFRNPNRSNHHNVNAFHSILVDQKAAYLVGREPTISVRGAEDDQQLKIFEDMVTCAADEKLNGILSDLVIGASNKGVEYIHFYYDEEFKLRYCIVPATEIIPIYDTQHQSELIEVIRYYDITVVNGKEKVLRKKVEWWTKDDVTFYAEDENGKYLPDNSYSMNPMPHWFDLSSFDGKETVTKAHGWGRVPFVVLENNARRISDLQKVKGLIDAYDLISSQGTNDLLDLVTLYWSIQGYGGETADAIARKLQINRAVNISDSSGSIDAKQVNLPVSGRIDWLKMLRRDIFDFGMGVYTDSEKLGNASGVSLKFQYTQLDLKANTMTPRLKAAIKDFFWFITDDYNRNNGTDFDSSLINISLNRTMITNDLEIVQMIDLSEGIVSEKTLLSKHPFVDDVNEEIKQIEAKKENSPKEVVE